MKQVKEIQVNSSSDLIIDEIYKNKKIYTQKFYYFMSKRLLADSKKLSRITNCGGFLQFKANVDFSKKALFRANFCKERGCPFCDWRKSIANGQMITSVVAAIQKDTNYEFLFGTLSSINFKADTLSDGIDNYNKAFKKMLKRKEILNINKGVMRKIEITYNRNRNDYNLHIHFLMAVDSDYFKSRSYLKQEQWLDIWSSVMQDNTIKNIYISKARSEGTSSPYLEIAKYSAKSTDLLNNGIKVFNVLMDALSNRQLITYNLIFKEYKKKYENGELDCFIEKDTTDYVWLITSLWDFEKQDYISNYEWYDFEQRELLDKETKDLRRRKKPFLSVLNKKY